MPGVVTGAIIGSIVGPILGRGARWLARKTKTKRDDELIDLIAKAFETHPELIDEVAKRIPYLPKP